MNIRGSKRVTREAMIYTDALLPLFLKIMVHFYDCLLWSILLCGSNIIITHKKLYLLIDMKIMPKAFGHETTLTSGSNLGHIAPFINPPSGYITFSLLSPTVLPIWTFQLWDTHCTSYLVHETCTWLYSKFGVLLHKIKDLFRCPGILNRDGWSSVGHFTLLRSFFKPSKSHLWFI